MHCLELCIIFSLIPRPICYINLYIVEGVGRRMTHSLGNTVDPCFLQLLADCMRIIDCASETAFQQFRCKLWYCSYLAGLFMFYHRTWCT